MVTIKKFFDFFSKLSIVHKSTPFITTRTDVIFQIFLNVIHNGYQKTPVNISLCETIHDACRSKKLIEILGRMGLCMSYNELERIDMVLAERVIAVAQSHHTRVLPIIEASVMIHGVIDNFDHEQNTLSGIGGSHETILMLFQNGDDTLDDATAQISQVPNCLFPKERSLEHIIDCQKNN